MSRGGGSVGSDLGNVTQEQCPGPPRGEKLAFVEVDAFGVGVGDDQLFCRMRTKKTSTLMTCLTMVMVCLVQVSV